MSPLHALGSRSACSTPYFELSCTLTERAGVNPRSNVMLALDDFNFILCGLVFYIIR